jgi:surface antigen
MRGLRVSIVIAALSLAACASDPNAGPQQTTGSVLGAFTGGLIGSSLGTSTGGRVAGAVAGAAVGGILGGAVGAALDERDRQYAYEANMRALKEGEPGAPVGWRSPQTGHYGTIVPGPAYQSGGLTCREFSHTVYIDGRPQTARGTACKNADGNWTSVG